ncbi:MAG: cyclic nucleotide-binding domain-containing protein, partial [Myxococcota bacterium]
MDATDAGSAFPEQRIRATVERYFGARSEAELESILAELEAVTVPGGEWLFRAGEADGALFLIARGRLEVWGEAEAADGTRGERLLGELGTGESVGEVGLLTSGTRSASVRAIRDTVLLRMDREAFQRLATSHPSLVLALAAQIATRLRDRTAARRSEARGPENIVILPLGDAPAVRRLSAQLASALEAHGSVRRLDRESQPERDDAALSEWLHGLETESDYRVLVAEPQLSPWSQLCLRHADLFLLVGHAGEPPSAGAFGPLVRGDARGPRRMLVLLHAGAQVSKGASWRAAIEPD